MAKMKEMLTFLEMFNAIQNKVKLLDSNQNNMGIEVSEYMARYIQTVYTIKEEYDEMLDYFKNHRESMEILIGKESAKELQVDMTSHKYKMELIMEQYGFLEEEHEEEEHDSNH